MSPDAGVCFCTEVVPRIRAAVPAAVNFVGCEDAQELVQDATAFAARMMHNVEQAGKKVTPGNIAFYTVLHMRAGRRSVGNSCADVLASGTQLKGRTRLTSLDEVAATDEENGGEIFEFHDLLAADQEDPATKAARKMDWETFCAGLSERDRAVIEFMVEGKTLRDAAHALRVSDSTMQQSKWRLAQAIQALMGANILVEARRQPRWKDNLNATRERFACREQRRHRVVGSQCLALHGPAWLLGGAVGWRG